jgi:hypothetical protein
MEQHAPVPADSGDHGHSSPEAEELLRVLERNRRTFAWKTSGLDAAGLRVTVAASSMTLGGLLKHMALVEVDWLVAKLAGESYGEPWEDVDFEADPDWEWRTAAEDSPEELEALWRHSVDRARTVVDGVLSERGLDGDAAMTWPDGRTPSVRAMVLDMIEEYARHTGHADLLREAVDGLVGEGAPEGFTL